MLFRSALASFELKKILGRKSEVAASTRFDWYCSYDSDEFRSSPWSGVTLSEAISRIDELGYNALDHTVLDFRPVNGRFVPGHDPRPQFPYFEFGQRPGHFLQIRAWKRQNDHIDLAGSGGHAAVFSGQRVFPLKFLLRHYSLRSMDQMQRKLIHDQKKRAQKERATFGWHLHLDTLAAKLERDGYFWSKDSLRRFDDSRFAYDYLVERISGIGIPRDLNYLPTEGYPAQMGS